VLFLILILFFFWPKPSFNDPAQGYGPKMGREPWKGNHSPFFLFFWFLQILRRKLIGPKRWRAIPAEKKKSRKKKSTFRFNEILDRSGQRYTEAFPLAHGRKTAINQMPPVAQNEQTAAE